MPRQKKLTTADKLYIDLSFKTHNNVNYDELFKRLAMELDKPEDMVRDYANKLTPPIIDEQLPVEPKSKVLRHDQEQLRDMMTPNRIKESNKARHITIMSEAIADTVEKTPSSVIKGSERTKSCIYRQ